PSSGCCRRTSSPKRKSPKASRCSRPRCRTCSGPTPLEVAMARAALPLTTVAVLDAPPGLPGGISLAVAAGTEPAEIRRATIADAPAIHALIHAHLAAGPLLPRTAEDVTRRAARFLVVTVNDAVVGCA